MPEPSKILLGDLAKMWDIQRHVFTNSVVTRTPILKSDARRWAIIFSSGSIGGVGYSLDSAMGSDEIILGANSAPVMWYFTQVGALVQQEWFSLLFSAGDQAVCTEVLWLGDDLALRGAT